MRTNSQTDILFSPWFLLGLVTLLLNDFVLKYEFANAVTGKLSDVAGLFIFPLFFSAFFPRYVKPFYSLTILIFGYWNSPLSQGLIDYLNYIGIGVGRTADPTDFFALAILPFSYLHFTQERKKQPTVAVPAKILVSIIAAFAFIATTLPRQRVEIKMKSGKEYLMKINKKELFGRLQAGYGASDSLTLNLADSLYYLHYYVPDIRSDMTVLASIKEHHSVTAVRLDSIMSGWVTGGLFSGVNDDDLSPLSDTKRAEHEVYFEKYFIKRMQVGTNKVSSIYYDNKQVYDSLHRQPQ